MGSGTFCKSVSFKQSSLINDRIRLLSTFHAASLHTHAEKANSSYDKLKLSRAPEKKKLG